MLICRYLKQKSLNTNEILSGGDVKKTWRIKNNENLNDSVAASNNAIRIKTAPGNIITV